MKYMIQSWGDDKCIELLKNVKKVLPDNGKVSTKKREEGLEEKNRGGRGRRWEENLIKQGNRS
jgi:hypothetical protein